MTKKSRATIAVARLSRTLPAFPYVGESLHTSGRPAAADGPQHARPSTRASRSPTSAESHGPHAEKKLQGIRP